ncbi:MAG: hypothetical protein DHS20C14_21150 [Phycisphaeraceae bacterium]|nr:MAG: hypothetical protein DHS20C14_21150 [Phycisphaeraceae bacterium]
MKTLAIVGMTEQEVTDAFDDAGIRYNPIVQPVESEDLFQIQVPLFPDISPANTIEYTITGGSRSNEKAWVIVVLDENGVVVAVE